MGLDVDKMKIAIIDDEKEWLDKVESTLGKYCSNDNSIEKYNSGKIFLDSKTEYDIVFMDIEIGSENGFDISAEYKNNYPKAILIILTTHTELSRNGYKVEAFRYIDKLHLEEIEEAIYSAEKKMVQEKEIELKVSSEELRKIKCRNIFYFEARGHNVEVFTTNGTYICKNTLEELANDLKNQGFYQVHRSYLVNVEYVNAYNSKDVYIANGNVINMSRRKYSDFKKKLFQWKMETSLG